MKFAAANPMVLLLPVPGERAKVVVADQVKTGASPFSPRRARSDPSTP